jgi:1-acyl-sn-glycerol-3-phosphate acyltransferase
MERVGLENLKNAPANTLFVSNHSSHLDGFLVGGAMPMSYHRKNKANRYPTHFRFMRKYYTPYIWLNGSYPIYPKSGNLELVLNRTIKYLSDRQSVLFFPVGRLQPKHSLEDVRPGVGFIAQKINPTIVPIYLENCYHIKPKELFTRKRKTKFIVGKPFKYRDITDSDDNLEISKAIMSVVLDLSK